MAQDALPEKATRVAHFPSLLTTSRPIVAIYPPPRPVGRQELLLQSLRFLAPSLCAGSAFGLRATFPVALSIAQTKKAHLSCGRWPRLGCNRAAVGIAGHGQLLRVALVVVGRGSSSQHSLAGDQEFGWAMCQSNH